MEKKIFFLKNEVGMAFDNWYEEKGKEKYYTGVFWAGSPSINSFIELSGANFYERNFFVTKNGFLFSKKGNIGGWTIESNKLHYKNNVGIAPYETDNTPYAFWSKNTLTVCKLRKFACLFCIF